MNKVIRLTESDLSNIIEKSVRTALKENMTNEGVWDNLKAGANAFFGKGPGDASQRNNAPDDTEVNYNLGKRWKAAKTNYQQQGMYDKKQDVIKQLESLIKRYGQNAKLGGVITSMKRSAGYNRSQQSQSINQIYK